MKNLLIAGAVSLLGLSAASAQDNVDEIVLSGSISPTLSLEAAAYSVNIAASGFNADVADITITTNHPGDIQLEIASANSFALVGAGGSLEYGVRVVEGSTANSCPCVIDVANPGGTSVTSAPFTPGADYVTGQLLTLGIRALDDTMLAGDYEDTLTLTVTSL